MRDYLNKTFMATLLTLSAISIFIGMLTGPFGLTDISIGFSFAGIIFASVIIVYSLVKWVRVRRRKK